MQNPSEQLKTIPLTLLIPDLLKQFNKPTLLGQRDVTLTKSDMDTIAQALEVGEPLPSLTQDIANALADIVQESINLLNEKFSLSFEKSLRTTDISDVADWETTADFLEVANYKSNAELRISAGTSIMVFLGDLRFASYLMTVIEVDANANDVDAMIAKRALSQTLSININADDWHNQVSNALTK